jgi:hypothetical protein
MGEMRNAYKILCGNPEKRDHSENLVVDGKIILECILGKQEGKAWIGCIRLKIGTSVGSL